MLQGKLLGLLPRCIQLAAHSITLQCKLLSLLPRTLKLSACSIVLRGKLLSLLPRSVQLAACSAELLGHWRHSPLSAHTARPRRRRIVPQACSERTEQHQQRKCRRGQRGESLRQRQPTFRSTDIASDATDASELMRVDRETVAAAIIRCLVDPCNRHH